MCTGDGWIGIDGICYKHFPKGQESRDETCRTNGAVQTSLTTFADYVTLLQYVRRKYTCRPIYCLFWFCTFLWRVMCSYPLIIVMFYIEKGGHVSKRIMDTVTIHSFIVYSTSLLTGYGIIQKPFVTFIEIILSLFQ